MNNIINNDFLREMKSFPNWVGYITEQRENGKIGKAPINPIRLRGASPTNTAHWTVFDQALSAIGKMASARRNDGSTMYGTVQGLGFVLSESDPFLCFDLDHVIDEDGVVAGWAEELVSYLDSYTELSLSGTGLHIWMHGSAPERSDGKYKHKKHITEDQELEYYESKRFIVMTGKPYLSRPIRENPDRIKAVMDRYLFDQQNKQTDKHTVSFYNPECMTDYEVIDRMFRSRSGSAIKTLWNGGGDSDKSVGDARLIGHLHFFCCGDPDIMERIFMKSRRVRGKTGSKRGSATYLRYSIEKYCECHAGDSVYDPNYRSEPEVSEEFLRGAESWLQKKKQ